MALFCAAIRRNQDSLIKFPFYSYDQVFSCEISSVRHLSYFSLCLCFQVIVFSWSLCFFLMTVIKSLFAHFLCSLRIHIFIFTQPLRSAGIWHKVNF